MGGRSSFDAGVDDDKVAVAGLDDGNVESISCCWEAVQLDGSEIEGEKLRAIWITGRIRGSEDFEDIAGGDVSTRLLIRFANKAGLKVDGGVRIGVDLLFVDVEPACVGREVEELQETVSACPAARGKFTREREGSGERTM